MAIIHRHPEIEDYFVQMTLPNIAERGGIADIFEEGRLIILSDYRMDFESSTLAKISKSIGGIGDRDLRKRIKKLSGTQFFEGELPVRRNGRLAFGDPVRQALFDHVCRGDEEVFKGAAASLKRAHEEILRIFEICFPQYEPFRIVPSLRLTRTFFENLHWDNHSIDDDFHQARIFANLDARPRIWNVGRLFTDWARQFYWEHDLGRFAGKDPNLMIDYITGSVLGGTRKAWLDTEPRHQIAFEPGEVWLGESRLISHQIYYGEAAMVYMWFVKPASMANPSNRFNKRVERLHQSMSGNAATAA